MSLEEFLLAKGISAVMCFILVFNFSALAVASVYIMEFVFFYIGNIIKFFGSCRSVLLKSNT